MAVKFRNLGITSDAPIEQWGVEGILTAIDRGTSQEWARIARAVQADPNGDVALDLEQAIELAESPGITALMTRVLADARASDKDKLAREIKYWIETSGMTRAQIAADLGTSRSRLSTYENGRVTPSGIVTERLRGLSERYKEQFVKP
ncbi:MAG: helix-turn-helix transcriptional regulator [Ancrocorticia sp.]